MDDVNMNHDLTLQEMLVYIRNRNETAFVCVNTTLNALAQMLVKEEMLCSCND